MSKKNSLKEKARRRQERESTRITHQNTIFHVVPTDNNGGYRRIYGECETCLLINEVHTLSNQTMNMYLQHECLKKFLTEEQVTDVQEAARQIVEKQRETPVEEETQNEN